MTIRKNILSGVLYTGITRYSGIVISIIIGAILARLLSPAEFGVVALVTVFISFFNILSNVGIGPAVIQNKELTEKDVQSIFLFSILLGFVLAFVFFFSSTVLASFYNNEELIPLTRLLSLTVLFTAFGIVPNALLLKKLKFKQVGVATIIVQLFSGVFAVFFAYKGFSYYALVYKSIFDGFFTFLLFYWLSPIRLKFNLQKSAIKKIMRFSTFQFFFNFINYFSRNTDNLLIGKFISPTALGYYDKSYQLMMMPVQNLTHVITPVLHPVLSAFQSDKNKIYNAYLKVVKLLATIGFPLSVFLYFSAHEIIFVLYGSQWVQSVPVFKILALTVGIQMVLSSSGSIFQAVNRTDLMFYSGSLGAIFMVSGICYGIFVGKNLEAVGYGLIGAFVINFFQAFYMLIRIALDSSFLKFLKIFGFPLVISAGVGVGLWLLSNFNFENYYLLLLAKIAITAIIFLLFNFSNVNNRKILLKGLGK
ncbi:lipopolysaccharide biosynthesis protein [Algoriphagus aquimarinus]|uniref:Lipopolysaccharide biosynthesis protein n=1 Tax=Algoriphagus aquimarinus TaxID=237018 RepID=A0A5C7A7T0_9BACT|nr:lipopolysaccharide biosynthesis protein [Algoriphagus aquimarinus]TXE02131.1 lipopolysaccharide biosynthesis protein [Algoriphagus aquimarinus]